MPTRRRFPPSTVIVLSVWGLLALIAAWSSLASYQAYTQAGNWIDGAFFWGSALLALVCLIGVGVSLPRSGD